MNGWLEIILYVAVAAVVYGLTFIIRHANRPQERDRLPTWFHPGARTHNPANHQVKAEDEQQEHSTQVTVARQSTAVGKLERESRQARSGSEAPEAVRRTPIYKGRPARLWWLPEQEMPQAQRDGVRGTMQEWMVCPECSGSNPPGSVFCGQCGASPTTWSSSAARNST